MIIPTVWLHSGECRRAAGKPAGVLASRLLTTTFTSGRRMSLGDPLRARIGLEKLERLKSRRGFQGLPSPQLNWGLA